MSAADEKAVLVQRLASVIRAYRRRRLNAKPTPTQTNWWKVSALVVTGIVALFIIMGIVGECSGPDNSVTVKESDYGSRWPLTVPEGMLTCERGGNVFLTVDDKHYGVNGTGAIYVRRNYPNSYRDIRAIWKDNPDPDAVGPKVSIGPLIRDGLNLCDDNR